MPLSPGTQLGPYEIGTFIDAGGMGEVYRARDPRLRRDVAIKVLPTLVAHDQDRLRRFEREARAAAALNHSNILAIYDVGMDGDVAFVVSELLIGTTLRKQLADKPLPLIKALDYGVQMATGLAAAHENGIVHRDMKPENLFLTEDGLLKILDFGLAMIQAAETSAIAGAGAAGTHPTSSSFQTGPGQVLGTIGYMSPEQLRGQEVDHRSDIFNAGAILFEMLSGTRAFAGASDVDTLTAILMEEPQWPAAASATVPSVLKQMVQRCLEKNPARRFQSAADLAFALEALTFSVPDAAGGLATRKGREVFYSALVVFVIAVAAIGLWWRSELPVVAPIRRLAIQPPPGTEFTRAAVAMPPAITPDGTIVLFFAAAGGAPQLYRRKLDELEAVPIRGAADASRAFVSRDGKTIAFVSGAKLQTLPIEGGVPVQLPIDAPSLGTWTPDGSIVLSGGAGLVRVDANGAPVLLTRVAPGESAHSHPFVLPDGRGVLFTSTGATGHQIQFQDLPTGTPATLTAGSHPTATPTGHLLFARDGALWAVGFEAGRAINSVPTRVIDHLYVEGNGTAYYSVGNEGTLVYTPGVSQGLGSRIVGRSRDGATSNPLTGVVDYARYPKVSPDGRNLAITLGPPGAGDIWVYDVAGARQPIKLTSEGHDTLPIWTPDSQRIVFRSTRSRESSLWSVAADASSDAPTPVGITDAAVRPLAISPDGLLMYSLPSPRTARDLYVAEMSNPSNVRAWLETQFEEDEAALSPNGKIVAYVSNSTGAPEIWVRPFAGGGAPVRVSNDGGHEPRWSADSRELFFQSAAKLIVSTITMTGRTLVTDTPRELFAGGFLQYQPNTERTYDVLHDGRLLMIEGSTPPSATPLIVVTNWFQDLARMVPLTGTLVRSPGSR